ncbi:MAG: LuxR C-terminal-related transcriptional regulator [Candidatus Promineifilaceae bacterium]
MFRVLIAHSSRFVCDSLRSALDGINDVYVVGGATTREELDFLLPHANLLILGTELGQADPFKVVEAVRDTHPEIKILVMGLNEDPDLIIRFVEAGASGYILRDESIDDMVGKLQAVREERAIVSPAVAAAMMDRLAQLAGLETPAAFMAAHQTQLGELTSRENEVLSLITDGCTNQEIADSLVIEYGTVKNHVHNILSKLEVRNRHEAASLFSMQQQPLAGAAL